MSSITIFFHKNHPLIHFIAIVSSLTGFEVKILIKYRYWKRICAMIKFSWIHQHKMFSNPSEITLWSLHFTTDALIWSLFCAYTFPPQFVFQIDFLSTLGYNLAYIMLRSYQRNNLIFNYNLLTSTIDINWEKIPKNVDEIFNCCHYWCGVFLLPIKWSRWDIFVFQIRNEINFDLWKMIKLYF